MCRSRRCQLHPWPDGQHPQRSADDQPDHLHGEPLITSLEVQTYQDPQHASNAQGSYPPITGCESEAFNPVIEAA